MMEREPGEAGTDPEHDDSSEGARASEQARLDVVVRAMGDGVIVCDAKGQVETMNPAAELHTGWTTETARGRLVGEVFPVYDELNRERLDDPVKQVLETRRGIALHDHTLLLARDGQPYPVAYNATPIFLDGGRLDGVVLAFRDMRYRRRLEEELMRSAKLEAVAELSGQVAHDFNNILAAASGSVSLALRRVRSEDPLHPLLLAIETACQRGRELTDEMAAQASRGVRGFEAVDLAGALQRASEVALTGSNAVLRFEAKPELSPVCGDPGMVRQALQNLLRNAAEAMPRGGEIRVEAHNTEISRMTSIPLRPGPYVRITIEDTGEGITQDELAHIFEPFYSTRPTATGLGLATVESIVHGHDGYLSISSEVGRGTRVSLYWPAASPDMLETMRPSRSRRAVRILVMDDDSLVRTAFQRMLSELGYEVAVAENGEEAYDRYADALREGRPFDLVMLDVVVDTGKGGIEVMRELAALDSTTRAIVVTGFTTDPVLPNYRDYGFAASLQKPFGVEDLEKRLAEVLG